MKILIALFAMCAGCTKPCEGTAKHAAAMMRYCVQTDAAPVCSMAYESVRHALSTGACSAEVVAR